MLGYVGRYWLLLIFAFLGFVTAAAAEGYFVTLFGNLIDGWDDAQVGAAATIPIIMAIVTVMRAVGAIVGEAMSRVSFGVVYDLREQLFSHILKSPAVTLIALPQGHTLVADHLASDPAAGYGHRCLESTDSGRPEGVGLLNLYVAYRLATDDVVHRHGACSGSLVVAFASNRFRRISRRIQHSMGDVTHVVSEVASGYREGQDFWRTRTRRKPFSDSEQGQPPAEYEDGGYQGIQFSN